MNKEKQVEESCELIVNSLLSLLKDKALGDITLTEIANNAGVARMTLYRHFKTKEHILKYRADKMMEIFKYTMEQNFLSTEEFLIDFFTLYKNLPLKHLITIDEEINTIIYTNKLELNEQLYLHLKNLNFPKLDDYSFNFLIGGMKELLNNWCLNNFEEDPIFLTQKIMPFINTLK